ncbi:WCX domain-containing protein [Streptomyces halobius]|uniref:WYL domain-containing protein n=1 Tax=Streptomyces halobius TaxID=2879846 RepID=A0ABY4M725_9ACTN|nr:WYL domain-containing protein [Streptomyces halobius]UQA93579.1 WYL domain-containing protein [Streptomyces halobius]
MTARIRRDRLDLAGRILGPALTDPPRTGDAAHEADEEDEANDPTEAHEGEDTPSGATTPTDWATLHLAYPVLDAVRQLRQFGDSLEVLDPPEARQALARAAAAIADVYATDAAAPDPTVSPGA